MDSVYLPTISSHHSSLFSSQQQASESPFCYSVATDFPQVSPANYIANSLDSINMHSNAGNERKRKSGAEASFITTHFKDAKESKNTKQKTSVDNENDCVDSPTDYIHVRARRGQATDSHSLAERLRREKISERMKMLQKLVPGCDKVNGKAHMLDEIIYYVQSLQNQVEFLSMKLAALSPIWYDFGMDFDDFMNSQEVIKISTPQMALINQGCNASNNVPLMGHATQEQGPNSSFTQDNAILVGSQTQGLLINQMQHLNMCTFHN